VLQAGFPKAAPTSCPYLTLIRHYRKKKLVGELHVDFESTPAYYGFLPPSLPNFKRTVLRPFSPGQSTGLGEPDLIERVKQIKCLSRFLDLPFLYTRQNIKSRIILKRF
jgi:hypothetical protein